MVTLVPLSRNDYLFLANINNAVEVIDKTMHTDNVNVFIKFSIRVIRNATTVIT